MQSEADHYAFFVHILVQLPDYIPREWHDRIRVVLDEKGVHYLWTGWNNGEGHGKVSVDGKAQYTHRIICSRVQGRPLSKGEVVDHNCRHRPCLNGDHLEPVTVSVNTNRGNGIYYQFKRSHEYGSDRE